MAYTLSNSGRLFYKDLATGREKEIAADGGRYDAPVFNPDGNGLMCDKDGFVTYVPLSGGLPKRIWDKSAWSAPSDWSPDSKTLLFLIRDDLRKPFKGAIQQLDLDSLSATTFLDDPEFESWQAHFSHDGRWVTFNATANDGKSSRIYVVPFRKARVPRSEWIPVTHGEWDDKPRFSSDDKLIFFMSGREDRPHRIWAQKVGSDMRPDGNPVALYPPGQSQPSAALAFDDISVGPRMIAFTQDETTGNIWLLEPAKAGAK